MSHPGRVEARMRIPSGSATASASTGADASPTAIAVPAGNYYMTAAGGVPGLLSTLQQHLNDNVQGYPLTAAAMRAAVGYGTWVVGWLLNEPSGNAIAAFGAPALVPSGTPVYGDAGPRGGIDKAISFDNSAEHLNGGNVHNVGAAEDLAIAWVGYHSATLGTAAALITKREASVRWMLWRNTNGNLHFTCSDGVATVDASVTAPIGSWYVGIAVLDRGATQARVAVRTLAGAATTGGAASAAGLGALTNANSFRIGAAATLTGADVDFKCAGAYIGTGVGAASSMSANLATAVQNFANAVNAAWSVALGADGRVTIANSHLPSSVAFTNTTLRNLLGFDGDVDYPTTPAQVRAALGDRGTWTTGGGWLFDEASGNAAPAFGGVTLTAVGTPSYGHQGPRGGADKAIGFTTAATDRFTGADNYDPLTGDAIVLAIAKVAAHANGDICGKSWGTPGAAWLLTTGAAGAITFWATDGTNSNSSTAAGLPANEWCALMGVLDRSTQRIRSGFVGLRSGTTALGPEQVASSIGAINGASDFTVGRSGAFNANTNLQIAALYVVAGPSVATGLSANLSTALSSFAAYMKGQTGTKQAKGVWYPGSPLNCDDHPSMAPRESDLRWSESPTGIAFGLCGNERYAHANVRWERCLVTQIRESSATYGNASLETFFRETQTGLGGVPWFTPASPVQVYWHNAGNLELLGSDANGGTGLAGWTITGVSNFSQAARMSEAPWTGQFDVRFPRLVSNG